MLSHFEIEYALQAVNQELEHIVYGQPRGFRENDILRVLTLMACIRTRALEKGWDKESDDKLDEAQLILQSIKNGI
jgi:hypothetical protein